MAIRGLGPLPHRPATVLMMVVILATTVTPATGLLPVYPSSTAGSPDFTLSLSTGYLRLAGGFTASFDAKLTSLDGFQGNITLSIDCGPLEVKFNLLTTNSPVVPIHSGETANALVAISVPYNAAEGTYCGALTATSGGLVRSTQLIIEIPPFGVGTRLIHNLLEQGSRIDLLLTFPMNGCFQVVDWGSVTSTSNSFSVKVTIRNGTLPGGTCAQFIRSIGNLYYLGHLRRDNYTFNITICLQTNDRISCRETETLAFTTIDDTAPIWPSDSEIRIHAITETFVTFTWTYADDNFAVGKYRVYIGSKLIGTTHGNIVCEFGLCLHYNATGLAPGETYTFRMEACDISGNCSLGPATTVTMPGQPQLPVQWPLLPLIAVVVSTITLGLVVLLRGRRKTVSQALTPLNTTSLSLRGA